MRKQSGFTLIEIAIVLVIIGLLLGGVLKGQELITSARVRNLISQQDGVKAAYFGFLDRFRALPGDYSQASANIANVAAGANGNGNGQITNGTRAHDRRAYCGVGPSVESGLHQRQLYLRSGRRDDHHRADQSLRSLHPGDLRYRLRRRRGLDHATT